MIRSEANLRHLADEATPLLEAGLKEFSGGPDIPLELQLRTTKCGIATAALQQWLREVHDLETDRFIAKADLEVQDITQSRRVSHVVLRTPEGLHIDPTYSQFHAHVGLTHRVAVAQDKADLYPSQKIATFSDSDMFASEYANHVYKTDITGKLEPGEIEIGTDGAFRGVDEEVMNDFYTRLWSPDSSELFHVEDQKPHFQEMARKIADSMKRKGSL